MQITFLDVERLRRDAFRFTLRLPHEPSRAAMLRSWDVVVDPNIIESFCDMLVQSVEEATAHPDVPGIHRDPFVTRGRGLYDALLPHRRDKSVEELRDALRNLHTPLLITHDDPSISWELLHDGEGDGFLGLKLDIGRRLRSRRTADYSLRRAGEWHCLVIADPNRDEAQWALPAAREEAEKLCEWLRGNNLPSIEFLQGEEANFNAVLDRLAAHAYDVIHYAGHVVLDPTKGEYALRLSGGKLLGADSIRDHVQGTPVVFLNACRSAQARALDQPISTALGMTDAFLEAGAQAVIGSLYPAPDSGARAFAEAFYHFVLSGQMLGQAMREARRAVFASPGCGPAWACFVLYGDPSLHIAASATETALRQVNLHISQFTNDCLHILEEAQRFVGSLQPVSSAHLFAAMIDSPGNLVADGLRRQGFSPHKLRGLFQELFQQQRQQASWTIIGPESPGFSAGARDILWAAAARSGSAGQEKTREEDLLSAFIQFQGSSSGHLLRKLGIDLVALAPSAVSAEVVADPLTIGPLSESDCDGEAWEILTRAAQAATSAGPGFVGTFHLFESLIGIPNSPLERGLAMYGVVMRSTHTVDAGMHLKGKMHCSDNLNAILLLAQANGAAAQRERISSVDLLDAFVTQGGGETGRYLMENGVLLEVLLSNLFLAGGDLDMGRFTEEAADILDAAHSCAVMKGNDQIDRDHLLYGMLQHCSLLRHYLKAAGADLQQITDRLYTRIPNGLSCSGKAALRIRQMAPLLVKVLSLATSFEGETQPVGANHLLRSWLRVGGGQGAELLLDSGVSLSGLAHSSGE